MTKAPGPSETQIQIALVDHLKIRAVPGVIWYHCPNGELRDKRAAAKLKAMGVQPGIPDLMFVLPPDGRAAGLELKRKSNKPTLTQYEIGASMIRDGALWAWADNIDDALRILAEWGVIK